MTTNTEDTQERDYIPSTKLKVVREVGNRNGKAGLGVGVMIDMD